MNYRLVKFLKDEMMFEIGMTIIWYMKPDFFRDGIMGYDWLAKQGPMPKVEEPWKTHIKLGVVKETGLERIWGMMQGENWSPNGEANGLIKEKGLHHTSMSMGDMAVKTGRAGEWVWNATYLVDGCGFKLLGGLTRKEGKGNAMNALSAEEMEAWLVENEVEAAA